MEARKIIARSKKRSEKDFEDIEFLTDDAILSEIAVVFLQIPDEIMPLEGIVGKKYEAVKDFCKWHGYERKSFVPVFLKMGVSYANGSLKNGKNNITNDRSRR